MEIGIGSEVLVSSRYEERIDTVTGQTPFCWKVGSSLYYKDGLRLRASDRYNSGQITLATKEDKDRIILRNDRYNLERLLPKKVNSLTIEQVRSIRAILDTTP